MKKLSIVLCCYNHGDYISRQLDAICKQSKYIKEIILVDDGSTDSSYEVMKAYKEKFEFINLIKNPTNLGLFTTVNLAANLVTGEYVSFLAADDIVDEKIFEYSMAALYQWPNAAWVCSDIEEFNVINGQSNARKLGLSSETTYISPEEMAILCRKRKFNYAFAQTIIFKTEYFRNFGFYKEKIGLWMDIIPQWVLGLRYGFIYIPKVLAMSQIDGKNWNIRIARNRKRVFEFGREVVSLLDDSGVDINLINKSMLLSRVLGSSSYIILNKKYRKFFKFNNIFIGYIREIYFSINFILNRRI